MPNWDTPKYYVYISDAKVEMLYAQVPTGIRGKLAAELKIDLKVVSATLTSKTPPETRYSKLRLVGKYLEEHFAIGTVDRPAPWFGGTLNMGWGPVSRGRAVYFGGVTESTILGLGGSPHHVIGSEGKAAITEERASGAADLFEVLCGAEPGLAPDRATATGPRKAWLPPDEADAVVRATMGMRGPVQFMEFLAKRVAEAPASDIESEGSSGGSRRIVLGTPLYVAQVD